MQVSEHVHAIKIPFAIANKVGEKVVDRFVYVFLIFGSQIYLIDTGVASSEQLIFDYIHSKGRKPEEIAKIFLTHSHPDHLGGLKAIKESIGCQVYAHQAEKDWIEDIDKQFSERPIGNFYTLMGGSVKLDGTVDDGECINLEDGLSLRALYTPGHSKGSLSFFLEADHVLVSGDAFPVPGDLPIYDDPKDTIKSINRLMDFPGVETLLSSWGEPVKGSKIHTVMAEGLAYVKQLHQLVVKCVKDSPSIEKPKMCQKVLGEMGLPERMALPLVIRSLVASYNYLDKEL